MPIQAIPVISPCRSGGSQKPCVPRVPCLTLKPLQSFLNFHTLEVVGRASETQLQVGKNLNDLIQRFKGKETLLFVKHGKTPYTTYLMRQNPMR